MENNHAPGCARTDMIAQSFELTETSGEPLIAYRPGRSRRSCVVSREPTAGAAQTAFDFRDAEQSMAFRAEQFESIPLQEIV
jgi:hypothetical protein